jgi:mRNA-degrading endonuclease RelE of RelBE toxin-antitoxin system
MRDLGQFPPETAEKLLADMECLEQDPLPGPPKVKKLRGHDLYRLRTGDYRTIFALGAGKAVILRIVTRRELERILRRL